MVETRHTDVAIVGGGPAGIAAAMALREAGIADVVVLERETQAGGTPRHCGHPPFGLREFGRVLSGPTYAARLVAEALRAGIEIKLRQTVVRLHEGGTLDLATPDGQTRLIAKRVILATGVRETPRSARLIGGERPQGIINTGALQAYTYLERLQPFRRPVIVGTELVAFSALLTCRKAGMTPVAMIEQRRRVTAWSPCAMAPRLFGVKLLLATELVEIFGRTQVEGVRLRDAAGLRDVACDGVILTGGFVPAAELVRASHLHLDPGSGGPTVDQNGRCSDPTYFAAGNLLRAVETAGWSWREGRRIGRVVAQDLAAPSALQRQVTIELDSAVKLAVPQVLTLPLHGIGLGEHIQLRVKDAISGKLVVTANGQRIWQRGQQALPERRILIPMTALPIPADATSLRISFEAGD